MVVAWVGVLESTVCEGSMSTMPWHAGGDGGLLFRRPLRSSVPLGSTVTRSAMGRPVFSCAPTSKRTSSPLLMAGAFPAPWSVVVVVDGTTWET